MGQISGYLMAKATLKSINMSINLDQSWKEVLQREFEKDYITNLFKYLSEEELNGQTIYPPTDLIYNAFNHTHFEKVKVVLLGQDPYHGKGQAHGLSFSVQNGVRFPPSLQNIFKELKNDFPGYNLPKNGNLTKWADQGVLLLNTTLTVEAGKPGSHQNKGWEIFTNEVIKLLSDSKTSLIFLLWGRYAQAKEKLINLNKHFILKAAHPSPFSAYNGFFGCKHFTKVNEILEKNGLEGIDWQIE